MSYLMLLLVEGGVIKTRISEIPCVNGDLVDSGECRCHDGWRGPRCNQQSKGFLYGINYVVILFLLFSIYMFVSFSNIYKVIFKGQLAGQ